MPIGITFKTPTSGLPHERRVDPLGQLDHLGGLGLGGLVPEEQVHDLVEDGEADRAAGAAHQPCERVREPSDSISLLCTPGGLGNKEAAAVIAELAA